MSSTISLVRQMQWWCLYCAAAQLAGDDMGLPPAPPMSQHDGAAIIDWLYQCAEHIGEPEAR